MGYLTTCSHWIQVLIFSLYKLEALNRNRGMWWVNILTGPIQLLLLHCADHLPQLITMYVGRLALRNVSKYLEKKEDATAILKARALSICI